MRKGTVQSNTATLPSQMAVRGRGHPTLTTRSEAESTGGLLGAPASGMAGSPESAFVLPGSPRSPVPLPTGSCLLPCSACALLALSWSSGPTVHEHAAFMLSARLYSGSLSIEA